MPIPVDVPLTACYSLNMKTERIGIENGRVSVYWMNHFYYSADTFATLRDAVAYARGKGPSAVFSRDGEILGSWDAIAGLRIERRFDAEYYGAR